MTKTVGKILAEGGEIVKVDVYRQLLAHDKRFRLRGRDRKSDQVVVTTRAIQALGGYRVELSSIEGSDDPLKQLRASELRIFITKIENAMGEE